MFGSYWRKFRSLGLAIAVTLAVLYPSQIWAKQAVQSHADTTHKQNPAPIPFDLSATSQWLWQPQKNLQTYQFNYYPQQQTDEGKQSLFGIGADLWVAVFTFVLVIATGGQAILILRAETLTRQSLRVSQRQAVRARIAAKKQFEDTAKALEIADKNAAAAIAAQRPWITIQMTPDVAWFGLGDFISITCNVVLKNVGESPAVNVHAEIRPYVMRASDNGQRPPRWITNAREMCAINDKVGFFGRTIFSNDCYRYSFVTSLGRRELLPEDFKSPDSDELAGHLIIAGIVSYEFFGNKGETPFVYLIGWRNADRSSRPISFKEGQIPASQISMIDWAERYPAT